MPPGPEMRTHSEGGVFACEHRSSGAEDSGLSLFCGTSQERPCSAQYPIRRLVFAGGFISARMASNTTSNCASYQRTDWSVDRRALALRSQFAISKR
jgi:hypothetical protein